MLHKRTLRQFTPILALALCLCLPAHATTDLHKDLIWAVEDSNATDLAKMLKGGLIRISMTHGGIPSS